MNGTALAVEASRTLLLEKDVLIKEAEGFVLRWCCATARCQSMMDHSKVAALWLALAIWENFTQKSTRIQKRRLWLR
jgi:hypothetical protein